jgi:hypothetical protein
MLRRALAPALFLTLVTASAAFTHPAMRKSPPWLSVEAPVNPYDSATRDAVFLVRAWAHGNPISATDLSGSAEGLVGGKRQSVALRLDATSRPDVYAVRRQWPAEGSWVVRVTLFRTVTAIVSLDRTGGVANVHVPTQMRSGLALPRPVTAGEIDSVLARTAAQR